LEQILAANIFSWLMGYFSLDIGIDLGTANTLVNVRGKGIVINEPSWVVINKRTHETFAVGNTAKEMVGRTPANYVAIRPLRDGVISEFEITKSMLEYFIGKAHQQAIVPMPRPRVAIGIPSGATEVEKRAVYDAAMAAGLVKRILWKSHVQQRLAPDCRLMTLKVRWWWISVGGRLKWRLSRWGRSLFHDLCVSQAMN